MEVPAAFVRALTLPERRVTICGSSDAGPGKGRLERWRSQPPFDQAAWWQERLAADGLSEQYLLALLEEPEAVLAARLPAPQWGRPFAAAMFDADEPETTGWDAGSKAVFAPVVAPLLSASRARLLERLTAAARVEPGLWAFDPHRLTAQLYAPLPAMLNQILVRTLILELHRSRAAGALRGLDAAQRFRSFISGLRDSASRRRALFTAYPVLVRQLMVEVDAWLATSEKFARHLAADTGVIRRALAAGGPRCEPVRVVTGLGDRHRGGASVTRVCWDDGTEAIYKPRPMQVDVHFQQLLEWVNNRGFSLGLRPVACVNRGDHGWMECVTAAACPDQAARHRFYHRQGALLALLYLLHASDFHAENLIAAGEDPVLVDLETILQPVLPLNARSLSAADVAAADAARASVMGAGLLPRRSWIRPSGQPADFSGLGYLPGQQSPLAVATIVDEGLDTMRIELKRVPLETSGHRPIAEDTPFRLLDYAPDILSGFTEVYQLCARYASTLESGPLAAFARDEVRILLRPTFWYATVLSTAFHPDLLQDALDRERHFDALWRDVPDRPELAACIKHERADMWRNDIPVFTTTASEAVLYDANGQEVEGLRLTPAMQRVRSRLAELSDTDLARQRWLIAGTLGTSALEAIGTSPGPLEEPPALSALPAPVQHAGGTGPHQRLLAAADAIGGQLADLAFVAGGSAQWLGINSPRGMAWSLGPLRPDLFHGLTGIALFLGWLGEITGDARHTVLARQAIYTARQQLDHDMPPGFGGMAGIGGLSYGLAELGKLWSDDQLIDLAEQCALEVAGYAGLDDVYDYVGGSAGTIAGLAALHSVRPSAALRACIKACADRLLAAAVRTPTGTGWISGQLQASSGAALPIAGFAHGVAGVTLPLFQAASILNDAQYYDAAQDGLRYEQALFDPRHRTWADLRDPARTKTLGKPAHRAFWCYGGVGIALNRLRCAIHTGPEATSLQEIDAALALLDTQPSTSHCLCHGDLGNIELLLQAAATLNRPHLHQVAQRRGLATLASVETSGWRCGMPLGVQTAGLMFGLAGIGYGMLRIVDPAHVPAVLTLTPGPAH